MKYKIFSGLVAVALCFTAKVSAEEIQFVDFTPNHKQFSMHVPADWQVATKGPERTLFLGSGPSSGKAIEFLVLAEKPDAKALENVELAQLLQAILTQSNKNLNELSDNNGLKVKMQEQIVGSIDKSVALSQEVDIKNPEAKTEQTLTTYAFMKDGTIYTLIGNVFTEDKDALKPILNEMLSSFKTMINEDVIADAKEEMKQ